MKKLINGKIFYNGINEEVFDNEQLDTYISNVKIYNNSDNVILKFNFDSEEIIIQSFLINSQINNIDNEHYVFSPENFNSETLNIIVIKITTNANEYDLMPVNYNLKGKTVLSIIMEDKISGDIYYWQGEIENNLLIKNSKSLLNNMSENMLLLNTSETEYDKILEAANEEYYKDSSPVDFTMTMEEYEEQLRDLNANKVNNSIDISVESASASSNNPFYSTDNIPNSVFQTVTNSWKQAVAWTSNTPQGNYSWNYYTYSYANYGSNNVYTLIMLLKFFTTTNVGTTTGGLPKGEKRLTITVEKNETVVYYKDQNLYDYSLGLNDLVKFYPSIELYKTGTDVGHIMADRIFGGAGYKSNALTSVGKAASIIVGIIDGAFLKGAVTLTYDVLDFMVSAATPQSVVLDASLLEFGYSVESQMQKWDKVIGSVKVEMDGYLRSPNNYFFLNSTFTASTQTIAAKNTWKLYYSIS